MNLDTQNKIPSGFIVPENYFEMLEQKIVEQTTQKNKVYFLWKQKKVWISSIAAVLVISFSVYWFPKLETSSTIPTETIANYLVNEAMLSTDAIVENLSIDDIENIENSLVFSQEIMENYLLEETNLNYYIEN